MADVALHLLGHFLQTPNYALECTDVRDATLRHEVDQEPKSEYPDGHRFTYQFLATDKTRNKSPLLSGYHGLDAKFKVDTPHPLPSVMLHYHYGAAALHLWGQNWEQLSKFHEKRLGASEATPGGSNASSQNESTSGKRGHSDTIVQRSGGGDSTNKRLARSKGAADDDSYCRDVIHVDGTSSWGSRSNCTFVFWIIQ